MLWNKKTIEVVGAVEESTTDGPYRGISIPDGAPEKLARTMYNKAKAANAREIKGQIVRRSIIVRRTLENTLPNTLHQIDKLSSEGIKECHLNALASRYAPHEYCAETLCNALEAAGFRTKSNLVSWDFSEGDETGTPTRAISRWWRIWTRIWTS